MSSPYVLQLDIDRKKTVYRWIVGVIVVILVIVMIVISYNAATNTVNNKDSDADLRHDRDGPIWSHLLGNVSDAQPPAKPMSNDDYIKLVNDTLNAPLKGTGYSVPPINSGNTNGDTGLYQGPLKLVDVGAPQKQLPPVSSLPIAQPSPPPPLMQPRPQPQPIQQPQPQPQPDQQYITILGQKIPVVNSKPTPPPPQYITVLGQKILLPQTVDNTNVINTTSGMPPPFMGNSLNNPLPFGF